MKLRISLYRRIKKAIKVFQNDDLGKLLLRVAVAIIMIFYGIFRFKNNLGIFHEVIISMGLPSFFEYTTYLRDFFVPIMLLTGIRVRLASLFVIVTMSFAVFKHNYSEPIVLNDVNLISIDLQVFYIVAAMAILFLGAGKYAIKVKSRRQRFRKMRIRNKR